MELRSTGNPDTSNPVTMSMVEYLIKKGIEAMSGTCKYTESVCPHMMMFKGKNIVMQLRVNLRESCRNRVMLTGFVAWMMKNWRSFFQNLVHVMFANIISKVLISVIRI